MRLLLIAVLFLVLLTADATVNELFAQTTTSGGLTGVIADPSGAVVPNADVKIKDNSKGITQSAKTDRQGVYRFFFLGPERYTLTVTHVGFREQKRAIEILLGPSVTVNLTLEIEKTTTHISVTGEAPLIQAENGDASSTMNQKQVSEVPNPGNDLSYIAQTAPGVVMSTDIQYGGSQFSILGMPALSYLYTMDGMNFNDNGYKGTLTGSLGLILGQNQVQEVTVVSTGYSGQFGGAAGGNVNYITKSGSNGFHGNAQYYWNGRVFNANDWFLNAFGKPRPFDNANQWASSLGGPIQKDKLFFFVDFEGLRLLIPQLFFVTIPSAQFETATMANVDSVFGATSASDAFYKRIFNLYRATPGANSATPGGFSPTDPTGCTGFTKMGESVPCAVHFVTTRGRPSQDTFTSARVDWNVGKNDRVFVRMQNDHGLGAFLTDPIGSLFDADFDVSWWQAQFVETHRFGSSGASQFLLGGTYFSGIYKVKDPALALSAFPTSLNFYVPTTFTNLGGGDASFALGLGRRSPQYQLSEDVVKIWGSQKFGFGMNLARIYWSEWPNKLNVIGSLSPQTLDAFYWGGVDPASPSIDFTALTQAFTSQTTRRISFFNFGVYGQDEWHARPNLTLTFSLRAEHYSNPSCRGGCFAELAGPFESLSHDPNQPYNQVIRLNQKQAFEKIDNILWSPRFSFAWQPFGVSHNTAIRGGVGVFYDPLPGNILDSFLNNVPIYNSYTTSGDNLTPNEKSSLFKDAAASNDAFLNGFAGGETLAQIQAAVPNFHPPAINVVQRRMHFPQYQRWSLEWQQGLGASTSVSIGYFAHHGIHELIQNPNGNAFGFGSFPTKLCASPPVPPCADPRFSEVLEFDTNAVSNYNGTVVSFKHQFTRWTRGMLQANYSYSHAFDEASNGGVLRFTYGSSGYPQDANNLRDSYGPAEYDARHSFNASYVWEVPVKSWLRGHGTDYLVQGWQVSGTIFARTGFPYTVYDNFESGNLVPNNYYGALYSVPVGPLGPRPTCGKDAAIPVVSHPCQPPQVLANGSPNPVALFVQTGCETGFNVGKLPGPSGPCSGPTVAFAQGRNRFRGPSYLNADFAIMKNTKIPGWEKGVLGIGFQFFNFFNHPNFGFPDIASSDPIFGQIAYLEQSPTSILGAGLGGDAAPRMIQLKVQLQF